jgi:O-antigen ligase
MAPAVALMLSKVDHRLKLLGAGGLALGGIALIFTLTRGGWVAAALAVAILCILVWRRGWLPAYVPLVVGLTVAVIGVFFQSSIVVRFFGDDRGAALARFHLMDLAWNMIQDHPLLGVGANNFGYMISEYATPEFGGKWLYTVHNAYFLAWAEIGLGGLLALLTFLFVAILRGWRVWRFADQTLSPLALGFTAALIGHMSHLYVDVFNARPHFQLVWLIAGLLAALATHAAFRAGEKARPR